MNIFEISQELQSIFDELEENGGELNEELETQLAITQEDFSDKIKSYTALIKKTEGDIDLIDKEITRLKELKDSKNKAITRLEKIIVWAVTMFGDTNKSGTKFFDYGTGKVSIRNNKRVEVQEDTVNIAIKNIFSYINMLNYTNELDQSVGIDIAGILDMLKTSDESITFTNEEFNELKANLSFDISIKDILSGNGYEFIKNYIKFINNAKVKPVVNKTELKNLLEENSDNYKHLATLTTNQTVTIK